MLSSISTFVLTSLSLVLVTADNSMPMPFELSIADDRVEACRHPANKAPEKATTSKTSLCFAGLKEGIDSRLHWRAMSTSVHLKNMTLLIKMKVRRLLIFSPGASIRMAGGVSVPVFGIMKELELASNFNGYGMVSGATNSSAIFEGQLNSTLFEGHIIYQNLSRSHTIQCFHSNTLKPDFYQSDSCIRCIVVTYDTRRHRASPVGWRSSNLPLCQKNMTNATAPDHQDASYTRLHSNRSTEGGENEEEDSSGFPKTGFSDYRMDVPHRATEIHSAPDRGMSVNAATAKRNSESLEATEIHSAPDRGMSVNAATAKRNSESLEATAEPPVNEVMHAEAKGQPGHPNTGERSSENGKNKSHSGDFTLYPSVKISDDKNTKGIEPPGDRDNTPEQETKAGASEEKKTGYVSDQLSSEVRSSYGRNNRSAKVLEPGAENGTGQSTQSPERRQLGSSPEASKAETAVGDGIRLLRLAEFTKKERSFSSQSDTPPDIKSSRKASSANQSPPRTAYSTKWKPSRKQYPAGQSSSIRQLSTNGNSLNSLRKQEPVYQNARTSRKQRSTNPNSPRKQDSTSENTYPNFSRKQRSTLRNTSRKRRSISPNSSKKQGSTNEDTSQKRHSTSQNSSKKQGSTNEDTSQKRRSTSQNSSKKQISTNEDTSQKRRSTSQNSSKKQGSTNEDTLRKRRPANQNFARRTRRSTGQPGTHSSDDSSFLETVSCSLHLVADHLFFNEMGDSSTAKTVNLMLSVVIGADAVFRATDFDGDGVRDNIGFQVKNITIIHNSSAAFYGYSRTNGNSFQYLRSFSTADFSDVCLGVAFTAIDFDRGVVGLAWYASSLSGGAGACFRRGSHRCYFFGYVLKCMVSVVCFCPAF